MKWKKVYVKVIIEQDSEGNIRPMSIVWTDGHTYEVDRLKQKCRAASLKVGGTGIRYTVMICGKETYDRTEMPALRENRQGRSHLTEKRRLEIQSRKRLIAQKKGAAKQNNRMKHRATGP